MAQADAVTSLHERHSVEELAIKVAGQCFGFFTHGYAIEGAKMEAATADDVVALLRNWGRAVSGRRWRRPTLWLLIKEVRRRERQEEGGDG